MVITILTCGVIHADNVQHACALNVFYGVYGDPTNNCTRLRKMISVRTYPPSTFPLPPPKINKPTNQMILSSYVEAGH